jgi:fructosamine-3-kinase
VGETYRKERATAPPGFFAAEAHGLRWLAEAAACAVPAVHEVTDTSIVMDRVLTGAPSAAAAERFGHELAALHRSGAARFGAPWRGYIGDAPMPNEDGPDWPAWFAAHRIRPYLGTAGLPPEGERLIDEVVGRIGELAGPPEPVARLHGDLWSGNVLWGRDARVWLIDPAAHGGHRETDLAMLRLFGLPHLEVVLRAYDEAWPLADGWRERVPLHQLFPLLVHAGLFGGHYREQAVAAARSALRPV